MKKLFVFTSLISKSTNNTNSLFKLCYLWKDKLLITTNYLIISSFHFKFSIQNPYLLTNAFSCCIFVA